MSNQFIFTNNATTTLTSAIASTSTTLQVASGAPFPVPAAGQQFGIWMTDAATGLVHECIYVTANSANQFTALRGQEGTAATTWVIGDAVQHVLTAGSSAAMGQTGTANTWTGTNTFDGTVVTPNATAPNQPMTMGQSSPTGLGTLTTNTTVTGTAAGTYYNVNGSSIAVTITATTFTAGQTLGFLARTACTVATSSGTFYGGSLSGSSLAMPAGSFVALEWDGVNWRQIAGSFLPSLHGEQSFTTSTTWTCPAGVTQVRARVWAGGAAGANSTAQANSGGGGGGGGYGEGVYTVVPGAAYTITVGAGGSGTAGSSSANGNAGGASSFATFLTVTGGVGGTAGSSGAPGTGGAGGSPTGATVSAGGQQGGNSGQIGTLVVIGQGGGTFGSSATLQALTNTTAPGNSPNGTFPGGGGAGSNGGTSGSGANGLIVLEY